MNESTNYSPKRSAFAVVIGLALIAALAHGLLDGRWTDAADLQKIGARLNELPDQFGSWEMVQVLELEEGTASLLRCHGSAQRVYRNQETGAVVNVALLFGPRGPIAVHTPEICYDSVGTKQASPTRVGNIRTAAFDHGFWTVEFKQDPSPDPSMEVWYGWSTDGKWHAAKHPRFWVVESLYKIQLAGPVGNELHHPCREFLEEFLPFVEKIVGSASTLSTSDYSSCFTTKRFFDRT